MVFRVFNEKSEPIYEGNERYDASVAFDKHCANGLNGWVEDENGNVMAGRKPAGTINLTPTWTSMLPMLLALYVDGRPSGRAVALEELQRMARIADSVNNKGV